MKFKDVWNSLKKEDTNDSYVISRFKELKSEGLDGLELENMLIAETGLSREKIRTILAVSKDVGVDYAGPIPKSGLAAQDLEGDSSSTKSQKHPVAIGFNGDKVTIFYKDSKELIDKMSDNQYDSIAEAMYHREYDNLNTQEQEEVSEAVEALGKQAEKTSIQKHHFENEIGSEEKAHAHYHELADENPEHGSTLDSMAEDEAGHSRKLNEMELEEEGIKIDSESKEKSQVQKEGWDFEHGSFPSATEVSRVLREAGIRVRVYPSSYKHHTSIEIDDKDAGRAKKILREKGLLESWMKSQSQIEKVPIRGPSVKCKYCDTEVKDDKKSKEDHFKIYHPRMAVSDIDSLFEKDIRNYGQKVSAGNIVGAKKDTSSSEYDLDADMNNVNTIGNETPVEETSNDSSSPYDIDEKYTMTGPTGDTKKHAQAIKFDGEKITIYYTGGEIKKCRPSKDIQADISKIQGVLYSEYDPFEKKVLYTKLNLLREELYDAQIEEKKLVDTQTRKAMTFMKSQKTPSFKDVWMQKDLSNSEMEKLVDEVTDRLQDGDYNWKVKAVNFLRSRRKGISEAEIAEILDAVQESPAFNE